MAEAGATRETLPRIALCCAVLTLLFALLTLVGWISGLSLLASVRARYIPMAPSTALCFCLIGAGIIRASQTAGLTVPSQWTCLRRSRRRGGKAARIYYWSHFGIDAWLVRNPGTFGAVPTGRMAPVTAADFVVTAAGLFCLTNIALRKWAGCFGTLATSSARSSWSVIGTAHLCFTEATSSRSRSQLAGPSFFPGFPFSPPPELRSGRCALFWANQPARFYFAPLSRLSSPRPWLMAGSAKACSGIGTPIPHLLMRLGALVFAGLITVIVSEVSLLVGGRIDRAEAARNHAQQELLALNARLEERVEERTRELREKNQQIREQLQMARELQIALLPQQFPTVPRGAHPDESALRFLSLFFPTGDVSGDFFSVFPVGEKSAGVLICDVMGHGVRSALITGMIRGLVEENAEVAADPGELLTRIRIAP